MSDAIYAHGTLLKIGDGGSPENFTTIAEVRDITLPHLSLDTVDVTTHDSGGWREFIGGIKAGGDVTFDINFIPTETTHSYSSGLIKDLVNKTKRNFKVVFPDTGNTTWSFTALVTDFTPKAPVAGSLSASVTLKITGQPTLA